MTIPNLADRPRCVLVAVQEQGVSDVDFRGSVAELRRLCSTLGLEVVGEVTQRLARLATSAVLGTGKLKELAAWTGGTGEVPTSARKKVQKKDLVDEDDEDEDDDLWGDDDEAFALGEGPPEPQAELVVVDHELAPSQLRNLEKAAGVGVIDRTGVILEIFHRHASSREAKAQVEIARLAYLAPRLREASGGGDRVRGGVGGKGAGESDLELDRRKIRDRIAELKEQLQGIEGEQALRRQRRKDALRVALVGYTNAGKSTWMRALTGSEVLVADKLFATLDTTVRVLQPETKPRILISDTVGFIQKLPHDLVASFRSTLDEALEASLLVYVVDASDPAFRGQLAVTQEVLGEIGAGDVPSKVLLNKVDRLDEAAREALRAEFPDGIQSSAKDKAEVARVRQILLDTFTRDLPEATFVVPYDRAALIGEMHARTSVVAQDYLDDGIHFTVRAAEPVLEKLRSMLAGR